MADILSTLGAPTPPAAATLAHRSLEAVRRHLWMDVGYLSEFVGEDTLFREVDAPGLEALIKVGDSMPLEQVYCRHILAGRLPELIPDTSVNAFAASLPITANVPIGAHVSVPIRRAGGDVYGMFCFLSTTPRPALNDRDLHIVRAFAGMVAEEMQRETAAREALERTTALVRQALQPGALSIFLQPICAIVGRAPLGFEALSRFLLEPVRRPDVWFADAAACGLSVELECAAIEAALSVYDEVPDPLTLSVNASPSTVCSGALSSVLGKRELDRLTLEITEHAAVESYDALNTHLAPLRARGLKLAIDDAGAGFAGLQHILRLQPDIIKLDMTLIRTIDSDPARRALAGAMQMFARQTGAILVAEGVETCEELVTLGKLGFMRAQGHLLGEPQPWTHVIHCPRASSMTARA
jgi:EAL domain-containing protein (putative c-di-GMP-specific phosphodiesterase class I)